MTVDHLSCAHHTAPLVSCLPQASDTTMPCRRDSCQHELSRNEKRERGTRRRGGFLFLVDDHAHSRHYIFARFGSGMIASGSFTKVHLCTCAPIALQRQKVYTKRNDSLHRDEHKHQESHSKSGRKLLCHDIVYDFIGERLKLER